MTVDGALTGISNLGAAIAPVLAVGGVYWTFKYMDKKKSDPATESIFDALGKLWPLVPADVIAAMVTQQPAAYFTISKLVAERAAVRKLKEIK